MRFPLTYVQWPPGTGKTNTILNTIITAFFNERTVLFSSYNNHPIDGVFSALQRIQYRGRPIPFPVVRLGSNDKVDEAIDAIRRLYEHAKGLTVYDSTLDRNKSDRIRRAEPLTELLGRYDEIRDLTERRKPLRDCLNPVGKCISSLHCAPGSWLR